MATKQTPKKGKKSDAVKNVTWNQTTTEETFNRLKKYSDARGYTSHQEATRVILIAFLDKNGF